MSNRLIRFTAFLLTPWLASVLIGPVLGGSTRAMNPWALPLQVWALPPLTVAAALEAIIIGYILLQHPRNWLLGAHFGFYLLILSIPFLGWLRL
jgi:hypothetical protein